MMMMTDESPDVVRQPEEEGVVDQLGEEEAQRELDHLNKKYRYRNEQLAHPGDLEGAEEADRLAGAGDSGGGSLIRGNILIYNTKSYCPRLGAMTF